MIILYDKMYVICTGRNKLVQHKGFFLSREEAEEFLEEDDGYEEYIVELELASQ